MNSVIKGTSYILAHTPEMVLYNGTTQTTERTVNPDSEYLKELPKRLRSYEEAVAYYPNQVYIGNITPEELAQIEMPWYDKPVEGAERFGPFGEIMPNDEFLLMMQISDEFDLVKLEAGFAEKAKPALADNPVITPALLDRLKSGLEVAEIEKLIKEEAAEPLYFNGELVGCVKRAHNIDPNLSAHVLHENLVTKASGVLAVLHALRGNDIKAEEIEYLIECSESAAGDQNQRGGGNIAKSVAEIAGLQNATGSDTRGFCAAPAHALLEAAALVKAGVFKCVAVTGGGCTAKLGMNGKDHIKKNVPILEDMIGGFCIIIGENDGVNPELVTDYVGRHRVGTGSAPQAVISALVTDPLEKAGLGILDVDRYSTEMQNPDITKPAGAGNVPEANYKMIAALAVMRGELERPQMKDFIAKHGVTGFAPTQGHIPSGVPYMGFARLGLMNGDLKRVMIVGKGSLFLGRLTNLFDGVSFLMEPNRGVKKEDDKAADTDEIRRLIAESMRDFAHSLMLKAEQEV